MSVEVVTFGCRLNALESEVIRARGRERRARRRGHRQHLRGDRRSRRARRARRSAGCSASGPARASSSPAARRRSRPKMFAAMPEVDRVLGNEEKLHATRGAMLARSALRRQSEDRRRRHHGGERRWRRICVDGFQRRPPRAFVQVQNGCDHRCTFCIIPYRPRQFALGADGRRWSTQVRAWSRAGHAEIVLTGVDITSYGARSARHAEARRAGEADPASTCRSSSGCGCRRSIPIEADRDLLDAIANERAADAASASVAAGRRRSRS